MSQISVENSPMCIHCLKQIRSCKCKLDGLPGLLRSEVSGKKIVKIKKRDNLADTIIAELQNELFYSRMKHDRSGWPHKFLHAHEGIGIIRAIEIVKKTASKFITPPK